MRFDIIAERNDDEEHLCGRVAKLSAVPASVIDRMGLHRPQPTGGLAERLQTAECEGESICSTGDVPGWGGSRGQGIGGSALDLPSIWLVL